MWSEPLLQPNLAIKSRVNFSFARYLGYQTANDIRGVFRTVLSLVFKLTNTGGMNNLLGPNDLLYLSKLQITRNNLVRSFIMKFLVAALILLLC